MEPISSTHGWGRDIFSLAMATQNIMWGIGVFVAGAIADRRGPFLVLMFGSLIYAGGVFGMSIADAPLLLQLTGLKHLWWTREGAPAEGEQVCAAQQLQLLPSHFCRPRHPRRSHTVLLPNSAGVCGAAAAARDGGVH